VELVSTFGEGFDAGRFTRKRNAFRQEVIGALITFERIDLICSDGTDGV